VKDFSDTLPMNPERLDTSGNPDNDRDRDPLGSRIGFAMLLVSACIVIAIVGSLL